MDENEGLTASRAKKQEDQRGDTIFRFWMDGKLWFVIRVPDEAADEFERLMPAYSIPQVTQWN